MRINLLDTRFVNSTVPTCLLTPPPPDSNNFSSEVAERGRLRMSQPKTIDPSLVAQIVRSYVGHTKINAADLPNLIATVHRSLTELAKSAAAPAVAINRSHGRDFVACLECGWRGVMLRRHLETSHGLTPQDYRSKWGLTAMHPIVAPAYANRRAAIAKQFDLGHRVRARAEAPEQAPLPTPASNAGLDPAFAASLATRARRGRSRRSRFYG
jgi:predicted transcriptional regulator